MTSNVDIIFYIPDWQPTKGNKNNMYIYIYGVAQIRLTGLWYEYEGRRATMPPPERACLMTGNKMAIKCEDRNVSIPLEDCHQTWAHPKCEMWCSCWLSLPEILCGAVYVAFWAIHSHLTERLRKSVLTSNKWVHCIQIQRYAILITSLDKRRSR